MTEAEPVELSIDETIEILRPALPDDSLVLVGGQAINYWLAFYRSSEPRLATLAGVTSSDVDFLGSRESVNRIAAALGGTVKIDEPRAPTLAVVRFVDRNGHERIIDFLRNVYGLEEQRVRETAIPVETRGACFGGILGHGHPPSGQRVSHGHPQALHARAE